LIAQPNRGVFENWLDDRFTIFTKAEALHLANRTPEALEAISEAEALVERSEEGWWCAEIHRLKGVFLTAIGSDAAQIEASFCAAIRIAKEAEVCFARETRRNNLRGIPPPKNERVRRTWIPATSLLTLCSSPPFVQGFPSEHPRIDLVHAPLLKLALQGAQR
jgi:hypothetical protein